MALPHSPSAVGLGWAVLLFIGQQITSLWLIERYEVTSGSMAPTLLGVHCHFACHECGREYDVGLDHAPLTGQPAYCPECGTKGPAISDQPMLPGSRVWLDRSAYAWREPRRWEVVAFRSPLDGSEVHVKRVVGLPGERVEIRHGDVYINGEIPERSLEQYQAMSILVHDATKAPPQYSGTGPRWITKSKESGWKETAPGSWDYEELRLPSADETEARLERALTASESEDVNLEKRDELQREIDAVMATDSLRENSKLLTFANWPRTGAAAATSRAAERSNTFSQTRTTAANNDPEEKKHSELRLSMEVVRGALVSVEQQTSSDRWGSVVVGTDVLSVIACGYGANPTLREGIEAWIRAKLAERAQGRQVAIDIVGYDHRQLTYSESDVVASNESYHWPNDGQNLLEIRGMGFREGDHISNLRVYRDIYYTVPPGVRGANAIEEPYLLGPDQYFVLGDNSELAIDSRYPHYGPIDAKSLVGKPIGVK